MTTDRAGTGVGVGADAAGAWFSAPQQNVVAKTIVSNTLTSTDLDTRENYIEPT